MWQVQGFGVTRLAETKHGLVFRAWTAEARFGFKRLADENQDHGLRSGLQSQGLGVGGWLTRTKAQSLGLGLWSHDLGLRG